MQPFTYMELADLRGRELQRQAERSNRITALTPPCIRAQPKALHRLRERLAFAVRRRRNERPQPLGNLTRGCAAGDTAAAMLRVE
jgi:hypothetical protein